MKSSVEKARRTTAWAAGAAGLVLVGAASLQGDPTKDIKAKEAEKRVAAIDGVKALGGEAAEKLLVPLLLDRDWEVVERAAAALRDVGSKASVPQLVKTAIDGPTHRARLAAAESLAKIDPERALADLAKLTPGKSATRAWEALAIVAPHAGDSEAETLTRNLKKAQKGKDVAEKLAAAGGLAGVPPEVQLESLEAYLGGDDIGQATAALEAVASKPHATCIAPISKALMRAKLDDTLERSVIASLCGFAKGLTGADLDKVKQVLDGAVASSDANVAARGMRLAAALGRVEVSGAKPMADAASAAIAKGCGGSDPKVRAAALHAGVGLGDVGAITAAKKLCSEDSSSRVRLVALREITEHIGVGEKEIFDLAAGRLASDTETLVREQAAVALAKAFTDESASALVKALVDRDWTVVACAAVSLGKTHRDGGLQPLITLSKDSDWKKRGAAIVGLCYLTKNEAVPHVITAIADAEPVIARTALLYVKSLTKQDLGTDVKAWEAWWNENSPKIRMATVEETKARREKYGYAPTVAEVFKDLDIVVLDSRGDHLQKVLDLIKIPKPGPADKTGTKPEGIPYRLTKAAHVRADALEPGAIYVSNCTGEVEAQDIEQIRWFIYTGGYLFGSCWSLHETIEKVYPGVVRKFETTSEVVDTVDARACVQNNAYLKGVYDGGVKPQYNLEGAHLIEVLDPERCEVLVDSPDCATRWGIGNLAVWFRVGHGLIFDSVNHFDNQGLTNATFLKEVEERQAYAIDRMGMLYADWRVSQNDKWWSSNTKAAERVYDRTALELVANFVRSKRLEEL